MLDSFQERLQKVRAGMRKIEDLAFNIYEEFDEQFLTRIYRDELGEVSVHVLSNDLNKDISTIDQIFDLIANPPASDFYRVKMHTCSCSKLKHLQPKGKILLKTVRNLKKLTAAKKCLQNDFSLRQVVLRQNGNALEIHAKGKELSIIGRSLNQIKKKIRVVGFSSILIRVS